MKASLDQARSKLLKFALKLLGRVEASLELLVGEAELLRSTRKIERRLESLSSVRSGDGGRIRLLRRDLRALGVRYRKYLGADHPSLQSLYRLLRIFPALVVPLEFRESSDVLEAGKPATDLIVGMLRSLKAISRGGESSWYVRGFIVSMTKSAKHLRLAAALVKKETGSASLPIVPLFEDEGALKLASEIVQDFFGSKKDRVEIMVGYSDSSKQMGVWPSRLAVAEVLGRLERDKKSRKWLFFHGSGGSVDRGGGSVQDQMATWPKASFEIYKATIQGEMVERTLASPEIAERQLRRIEQSSATLKGRHLDLRYRKGLESFASRVERRYSGKISSSDFLEVVEKATPYPYLHWLKIGSRPSKRKGKGQLSVSALRAIPWVLCWTQTRVLFPSWWGVGTAWKESSALEKGELKAAYRVDPVFRTFVQALGFTLEKVELSIWCLYLERSGLSAARVQGVLKEFRAELEAAKAFVRSMSGKQDLLWFRPWLGESIRIRSPMIHPINLLQLLAIEQRDQGLLRTTVTGIASGMLTTG